MSSAAIAQEEILLKHGAILLQNNNNNLNGEKGIQFKGWNFRFKTYFFSLCFFLCFSFFVDLIEIILI